MFTEKQVVLFPKGIARYPHLVTPDDYEGTLDFKTQIILNPADKGVQNLIDEITETAQGQLDLAKAELIKKGGKSIKVAEAMTLGLPMEPEFAEDGTETGNVVLKVKSKAAGVSAKTGQKWERKIPLFDAGASGKVKIIPHGSVDIWGGSVIKVEAVANPYIAVGLKLAGCSFYIKAVQVLELSSGSDSNGFGIEEGGFDASELMPPTVDSSFSEEEEEEADESDDF